MTAAITTLSGNTARLSEETTALLARVIEHQDHLENLLGLEEARRAQMDDHWRSIIDIKAAVEEVKTAAITQTDRFTAQLNGIRANTDTTTTALRTDVNNLRGRIIPSIREQSTAIADSVQRLKDRIAAISDRRPATTPILTHESRPATTPILDTPDEVPQEHDCPSAATSWYTRLTSVRIDDPAIRSRACPQPVLATPLDDYEGPLFWGGVSLRHALPTKNDRPGN